MDANSIQRYNVFTGITKTLRILELFLALLLLSWFLTHLRKLSPFIASPLFVFAISNAIIAALLAQSCRLTTGDDDHNTTTSPSSLSRLAEAEEFQKKLIINPPELDMCTSKDSCAVTVSDSNLPKVYRRSESEKSKEEERKTARRKLRRSETGKVGYPQDKLSNEEFQRTIEAFIAKQMRLLREESMDKLSSN